MIRSRKRGSFQARSPNSAMTAGTMSMRTTVASRNTAVARPTPNILMNGLSPRANAPNTLIMMSAAAVMTLADELSPVITLSVALPVRWYSSWMRLRMNTS